MKQECAKYPCAEIVWAQEEHKNQGPWSYVQLRFQTALTNSRDVRYEIKVTKLRSHIAISLNFGLIFLVCFSYAGRTTAASTATGSKAQHNKELASLLETALSL